MAVIYPKFVDNTAFIQMHSSVTENDQLQAMLNNLTRVHQLTARKFDSLDGLIREYLSAGCDVFNLETGIVSRIEGDEYQVLDVVSPLEVLERGQVFPLEDTYCREVVRSQSVVGFPEVGQLDYMNCHPVYTNLKLEAYLSAPIYVDDRLFGTLNFTSTRPRPYGFSANEHNLVLLMANAIGNYILLRNKNQRLEELNDQLMRFVGFVAHDLRNPIGGVLGLAQLAEMELDDKAELTKLLSKVVEISRDSLELINSILDISALSTGRLSADFNDENITVISRKAMANVAGFAQENSIHIQLSTNDDLIVSCDAKRLQQVLVNLLINAIKYSPKGAKVVLSVKQDATDSYLSVTNPMLSEGVAPNRSHNGLYESVGFGLEIVNAVLKAHNSELRVEENEGQFCAGFHLANCA